MSNITIQEKTVATVHYRGTLTKNGDEFDNSAGGDPLEFLVGFQQMIPGFEAALMGKSAGEKVVFNLSPDQAYGAHNPEGVQEIPLDQLPEGVEVGVTLTLQAPTGQVFQLRVVEMTEESATLDMNHRLAGEELTFEVEVIGVREANAEELSRGMTMDQISESESDCCKTGSCSS